MWRVATLFSRSALVPKQFRGQPENCFISLQMAIRLQVDPFMLMQGMFVIHGKPGFEAKLAIALVNRNGPFAGPIQYAMSDDGLTCKAFASHRRTGDLCEATCSMKMAKAEGWLDREGSKWKTMPELMLRYRAAMFLARLYCPEVLLGMQSADELSDIGPEVVATMRMPERSAALPARIPAPEPGTPHRVQLRKPPPPPPKPPAEAEPPAEMSTYEKAVAIYAEIHSVPPAVAEKRILALQNVAESGETGGADLIERIKSGIIK